MTRLLSLLLCGLFIFLLSQCNMARADEYHPSSDADTYRCTPCGRDCDQKEFKAPGECGSCSMPLVKSGTIRFKTIQPSAICRYINEHPNVLLLDVRTKDEFEGKVDPDFGSLKNAINIPVQQLSARIKELDHYKSKEIIVYCSHSHRSPQASYLLTQNGFTNVTNMAGGMSVMKDKDCVK